ncbi:Uncharacterized protein Adt_27217 [Abeliophyllum distichum]|uniref:Uncharacterized protein n=1 Tax=Abeliophyllum distichum TaxID=126358 RepID=A0ABD1RX81_9LAMI
MLQHMNSVLSGTRPKTLPYGMILTKVFQHFEVSFRDSVFLLPKVTNTINTLILKRMKFFKKDRKWVAMSKGLDDESGPSTLSFEGDEEDDELPSRLRSHRSSSSTSSFNKDQFNLLNGWINSLSLSVDGLHHSVSTLQQSVDSMTSLLQELNSHLDAMFSPPDA